MVQNFEDENLYLATSEEVVKSKWIINFVASKHIYTDQVMFNTLKNNREFSLFNSGSGEKIKVEGIGTMRMKLHTNIIQTFQNVRFVPFITVMSFLMK